MGNMDLKAQFPEKQRLKPDYGISLSLCWPTILHKGLDLLCQGQSAELSHGEDITGAHRLHTDIQTQSQISDAPLILFESLNTCEAHLHFLLRKNGHQHRQVLPEKTKVTKGEVNSTRAVKCIKMQF